MRAVGAFPFGRMPRVPSLKPYSQWDYCWVVVQTSMKKRRVRHPPQLGARRSMLRRGVIWWLDHAWARVVVGLIGFAAMLIGVYWLVSRSQEVWSYVLAITCAVVAAVASAWWGGGGVDGRCVAAAHRRVRCTRDSDRRALAEEIGDRSRHWKSLLASAPQKLRQNLLLQSTPWRIVLALYMFVLLSGPMIWPLASAITSPAPGGGLPARPSAGTMIAPLYQQGALFASLILMIVCHHVIWRRIKTRLVGAAEGKTCPDCGYEVERGAVVKTEPGIEIAIGPERCSECGSPWPLLPPEVPDPDDRPFWWA